MYNGGATAEWLMYQPAHASGDDFRIATYVGGVTTDRLKISPSGLVTLNNGLTVTGNTNVGDITASRGDGTGVIFLGGGSKYLYYDGTKYNLPGAQLTVGGTVNCGGVNGGTNEIKGQYITATGTDGQLRVFPRDGGLNFPYIYSDTNDTYRFQVANTGLLATLSPNGFDLGGRNLFAQHISAVGGDAMVQIGSRDNGYTSPLFYSQTNVLRLWWGADKTTFDVSGNFWTAGNITSASDARLKSNVRQLEDGLALATSLRGVRFEKDGEEQIGVIAQEVREVVPEVVRESEDGMLGVDYSRLTAVLIEAVKTLTGRVADLEAKLAA
jgi:hypothetical protein